ncbi:NAD(P)/FAD-dependent oxidoreductase [Deinococcus sp. KNUC1210]|uniref:NAD(P)/FAD-dependent oxidoreductase n=1 Tax=Deinococcus sp. KNUC1210 TaxID=2917691 RepID=UPI001EF04779|nr:NAD(P)/FAD-dependent oxidoreductase [Deinococcus sp. KNUC1210]ULH15791.1 NAD(P)/FAD-dependent oxidoreductase [Deinococcus sp. KNUC1210]
MNSTPAPRSEPTDILIIGGGPAGLYAAFYAALRGLSVRLLEARPELGGQLAALYPDRMVYDVPAAPAMYAGEIVERLVRQLEPFDIDIRLKTVAQTLEADGAGWRVGTAGASYTAGAVILTAGMGALLPRPANSEQALTDWPPAAVAASRSAWIQGGVPQATRAALELADAGTRVTLSHRRALFRGTPSQLARLERLRQQGQIDVHAPAAADFTPVPPADLNIHLNGYLPDLSPLLPWPLEWQGEYVPADANGLTTLPGVYVAGDLSSAGGTFKLITLAFAQAALCANHAAHHVRPELRVKPGHSSDRRTTPEGRFV